jgi:hypothetical protein
MAVTYLGTAKDPGATPERDSKPTSSSIERIFGLLWNAALETVGFLVGDEVRMTLSIQAIGEPEGL